MPDKPTTNTSQRRAAVEQALGFVQPARCPYYAWIDDAMVPVLAERFGEDAFIGTPRRVKTFAGSYTAMTEITAGFVDDDGDIYTDEYGVTYRRGSILHVERPALPSPSLEGYRFPDLSTDEHFEHLDAWMATHADRYRIVQLGMLFFERCWGMRGMENFFCDLHLEPAFVNAMLDGLEEVCLRVVDRLLDGWADRIDAIGMSEDYGAEKSLLIDPVTWRRFIRPRVARIADRVHSGGKKFYLHSCGNVKEIVRDLVDIGVNMLQPIQPEAMDIFELKREFGRDLCLVGGISTQRTLPFGTVQDVRDAVRRCLDVMAVGGGYIMAPAKPVLPGVPAENAIALLEAFETR